MSASMLCIWAYAAAKLAAYLFLRKSSWRGGAASRLTTVAVERVFIVHASGLSTPRYRCKWWIVGAASSILWLGAPIGMMVRRASRRCERQLTEAEKQITHSHHLDEDGICIIGLPR